MSGSASFWDEKPWWCQPWTIVLTGFLLLSVSWYLLHSAWLTGLLAIGVIAWWLLFLVLIPNLYLSESQDELDQDLQRPDEY